VTGQPVGNLSWAEIDDELKRHRTVEEACGDAPDFLSFDCRRAQALALATEAEAVEKSSDPARKRALSFSEYKHRHFLLALTKADAAAGDYRRVHEHLAQLSKANDGRYIDALVMTAEALAADGHLTESRVMFAQALSGASDLGYGAERSVYLEVTEAQARAGRIEDALDTATRLAALDRDAEMYQGHEAAVRVLDGATTGAKYHRAIAAVATALVDIGDIDRAVTLPAEIDPAALWFTERSVLVSLYAHIATARRSAGDHGGVAHALDRALEIAGGGKLDWSAIGEAAADPGWWWERDIARARHAVDNLITIASAWHETGFEEKARLLLEDAERAAGGIAGNLAEVAAARYRIVGPESGQETLADAYAASRSAWEATTRRSAGLRSGPYCSQDTVWFTRAAAIQDALNQVHGDVLPSCDNGPNFRARIAFATAHHAAGEWSRVLDALSCRNTPDYQTIIPGGEATIDATSGGQATLSEWWRWFGTSIPLSHVLIDGSELVRTAEALGKRGYDGEFIMDDVAIAKAIQGGAVAIPTPAESAKEFGKKFPSIQVAGMESATEVLVETLKTVGMVGAFDEDDEYADALRATFARRLAGKSRHHDDAFKVAELIKEANRRAEVLIEVAEKQVTAGMVGKSGSTLVRAIAAVEEMPDYVEPGYTYYGHRRHETNIQDQAIRLAEIAWVLARASAAVDADTGGPST